MIIGGLLVGCSSGSSAGHSEDTEEHGHGHGEEHEGDEVELTKAQMDAVGIRLGTFEARSLSEVVQAAGRLEVSAAAEGVVAPMLGGRVTRLMVAEGQQVRQGEVIAWVDAPEIVSMRQQVTDALGEVDVARQEVEAARVELRRQEALAAQGAGVRRNLDEARAALRAAEIKVQTAETRVEGFRKQLAAYGLSDSSTASIPVKSDVSGVVTAILVPTGGYADMQTPIVRVVNNSGIYCMLQVAEKDISSIKTGMAVDMQLTNDPGRTFVGKVEQVRESLDPETRTVPVKVSLGSGGDATRLIPGMAVSARVSVGGSQSMALPEAAVVTAGGHSYVFVLEDEDEDDGHDRDHDHDHGSESHKEKTETYHFRRVAVSTGPTALGFTEVTPLEDLPADTQVVVAGAFYLNSMLSDHGEHNH